MNVFAWGSPSSRVEPLVDRATALPNEYAVAGGVAPAPRLQMAPVRGVRGHPPKAVPTGGIPDQCRGTVVGQRDRGAVRDSADGRTQEELAPDHDVPLSV